MEDNSEDVRIGKAMHEPNKEKERSIDNIKLDKITKEYVTEIKKSDADIDAATGQLLFYLFQLKQKGIKRKGRLEVFEKNKQDKTVQIIELTDEMEQALRKLYDDIIDFLQTSYPPQAVLKSKCKKCAYYEYCFI